MQHESGHNQRRIEQPRLGQIGDPAVDDHAGVEQQRPRALHLLGEFHVRNDETKVAARLEQETDAEVANHGGQNETDAQVDRLPDLLNQGGGQISFEDSREGTQSQHDEVAQSQTHQQADIQCRQDRDVFLLNKNIGRDRRSGDYRNADQDEDQVQRAQLKLIDQEGRDAGQYENKQSAKAPDQHVEYLPLGPAPIGMTRHARKLSTFTRVALSSGRTTIPMIER